MKELDVAQARQLRVRTEKEDISDLPRAAFGGRIVVVQSSREAAQAVKAIRRETAVVGFDTETRPSFRKGVVHGLALVQIATPTVSYLFRLCMTGLGNDLLDLLTDEGVTKIGLSLKDDFAALRRCAANFVPAGFVDLQPYAAEMGIQDMSLQKLYANVFGRRISKSAQRSNWEADVLTEAQKLYAATDASTCLELYEELSQLRASGNYILLPPSF